MDDFGLGPTEPRRIRGGVEEPWGGEVLARWDIYFNYLKMKVKEHDWHGVADAAADLRELEARHPGLAKRLRQP